MAINSINVNNTDSKYTHSIFDISEYAGKTYDTLTDALADIPDGKKKGGMTVRYIQTLDNKYVQYRLINLSWSIIPSDWQIYTNKNNIALYNEINIDLALEAYINISTGAITNRTIGYDTYRLVKVFLKAGTYYIHVSKPGTQAALCKYTDSTYQTTDTIIVGNSSIDGLMDLEEGYYAIAWSSSNPSINSTLFPIVCIKDRIDYQNIENAPDLSSVVLGKMLADNDNFITGKYLNNIGELNDNAEWEYTPDYFKVTPGSILVLENMLNSGDGNNVAFYNMYKNFTGNTYNYFESSDAYQRHYITVPEGARYARFSRQSSSYSRPCVYAIGSYETAVRTPLITSENVKIGKYIDDDGVVQDADNTYALATLFIEYMGFYHIKAWNTHITLGKVNNSFNSISVPDSIALGAGTHDIVLWLTKGYYLFCWGGRQTDNRAVKSDAFSINTEPMVFEYAFELGYGNGKDEALKSCIFDNLITVNNTVAFKYLQDETGIIANASWDYRLAKIHIKYSGHYWIRKRNASSHPTIWEYDSTFTTPVRQILGEGDFDGVLELSAGYYAVCWTYEIWQTYYMPLDLSNTFIYRIDDLLNVIKDNITFPQQLNRINFSSLENNDLTIIGSSTRDNGIITLAAGVENRAYLNGSVECAHWEMAAKFRCTGGVSFIMGKGVGTTYGAWIELLIDNGVSKYIFQNNGEGGQYSHAYEGELGFTLNAGEDYTLRVFFNVTTTKVLGFEIFGQFNEYFTHTFTDITCNGYGTPFFYSKTSCVVKHSSISVQNYYDIKTAKMGVWGHSYVEGDSLGLDRDKTFTNLLADAIGANKVFNFGLGGDSWQGVYDKLSNEMGFASNIQYALICCGANDVGMTLQEAQTKINQIASKLSLNNIIPIFMTIPPTETGGWHKQNWIDTNAWIRANFKYVDMEQVFLNVDAAGEWNESNVRKNLYLGDYVHPSIQGHAETFKRIQMDCPYLF